jgi:hypothetical protein
MTGRTGIPSLMLIARTMCRLLTKFTPIIASLYPDNSALLAALAAANAACEVLHQELMDVAEVGV